MCESARTWFGSWDRLKLVINDRRFIMIIRRLFACFLGALFITGSLATLAGCNTMEGAGKDIQQGGKAITDEAREQKRN